ncbi:MAG: MATE family efflux transporter [Myxococcota bacterium]
MGAQFLLEVGAFVVLAVMISRISDVQMAAHQIAIQVIHFAFLPGMALSESASVMTGNAVGADRLDLVRPIGRLTLLVSTGYMLFARYCWYYAGRPWRRVFGDNPDLIETTIQLFSRRDLSGV